ncbi:hypothetical protein Skr01_01590 [Sphaerisporangium krabiense]|uniref:Uncharacterized protein n=1 Tax=Sphaerisporangium krabiense TaxID=763782 RepID=A0A7W8Z7X5_9ACTN|nr:hypothetical protein [Sphaerisporangium krabiense]GII60074.1 hypothetical protein Skr01_01590 [Sphaerisporangium krabiense]
MPAPYRARRPHHDRKPHVSPHRNDHIPTRRRNRGRGRDERVIVASPFRHACPDLDRATGPAPEGEVAA